MSTCQFCAAEFDLTNTFCPRCGSLQTLSPEEQTTSGMLIVTKGTIIDGKYRIDSLISKGTMGTVFCATHLKLNKTFALKLIHFDPSQADPNYLVMFNRQVEAFARINHHNIIAVVDFGLTPDQLFYIVMQYIEGITLRFLLKEMGKLSEQEVLWLARHLWPGLHTIQDRGLIHGDLKPENIIIPFQEDERLKIAIFGLDRLKTNPTVPGQAIGTPAYMSPEQGQGIEVDCLTDIYSLGVMFYEMLTGEPPFNGKTGAMLLMKHIHALPRPLREIAPDVSPELEELVMQMLAKKPSDRPQKRQIMNILHNLYSDIPHANPVKIREILLAAKQALKERVAREQGQVMREMIVTAQTMQNTPVPVITPEPIPPAAPISAQLLPTTEASWVGQILDSKYHVESFICVNWLGRFYYAANLELGLPVVINMLDPQFSVRNDLLARFQHGRQTEILINYTGIIITIDFGVINETEVYLVTQVCGRALLNHAGHLAKIITDDVIKEIGMVLGRELGNDIDIDSLMILISEMLIDYGEC